MRTGIPLLDWLPRYDRSWLSADLLAGLTAWGLIVPQGMAYADLAGAPVQAGLYTLLAALPLYAIFGSSRHLAVQATSATAALAASTVVVFGANNPADAQVYVAALALAVGIVFLIAGFAKLGFVTQFLSKPVMDGFVVGLAIFVTVGQLPKLFGIPKGEGNTFEQLAHLLRSLPETNWVTFAVGFSAFAMLLLVPIRYPRLPTGLIVLFGSIAISGGFDLAAQFGVAVVGELPQGLPRPSLPAVPLGTLWVMLLPAIGIVLLAFSEGIGAARVYGSKHGYEVDPDQELRATGLANVGSALFGGLIAGGSMSASAVKEGAGARTQVASLIAFGATVVTVLFLTPLFTNLPDAVLGALIIAALWHILTSRKLQQIRLISRTEYSLGLLTLFGVLMFDVLEGMIIGLVASLLLVIYRSSRPHISSLGRLPSGAGAFADLSRHPEAVPVPGILIIRLDAPMYYANAITVRDRIRELVDATEPPPEAVILDAACQGEEIDITGSDAAKEMISHLHTQGIDVYVADLHAPVAEFARKTGMFELVGEDRIFATVELAVRAIEDRRHS